jgi:hypothetical protein
MINELLDIFESLKSARSPHEPALEQVRNLFMPFRGDMTTRGYGGRRVGTVFDSTGAIAADALVNFMVGSLFPPTGDWVKLQGPDGSTPELDTDAAMVMLSLEDTNFYSEAAKCLKDLLILGNSVMYIEEDARRLQADGSTFEGLTFEAVNLADCYWKMGRYGTPLVFVREYYMAEAEVSKYFGVKMDGEPFEEKQVLHFVLPSDTSPINSPGGQKFVSIWIDAEKNTPLRVSGYDYQPYVVSRLDVVPGEQYGRGRGHLARPDAAGANEIKRQVLLAVGREINPPLMVEDESITNTDISASGILVVRPATQLQPSYLNSGTNFSVANEIARMDHEQIKAAFMADILLDPATQPRSAEESRQRSERLIQRLAGPARMIETGFLGPIMESVLQVMVEGGVLEAVEDAGILNVSFVSPFYIQQRELVSQKSWRFVARRLEIFAAVQDPALLDDIDFDMVAEIDAENSDVPAGIFRSQEDVTRLREARAQQAAQQQMMEMQQQQGGPGGGPGAPAAAPGAPGMEGGPSEAI